MNEAQRPDLNIVGYGILAAVASHKAMITYRQIYEILAARGRERWNAHSWSNPVKVICCETARMNKQNGEPLLASLVRRAEPGDPIGKGYAAAVEIRYGIKLTDLDEIQKHADAEAEKSWQYFGLS